MLGTGMLLMGLGWSVLSASSQWAVAAPACSPQDSPRRRSRTPQHPPPAVTPVAAGAPQGCPPSAPVHTDSPRSGTALHTARLGGALMRQRGEGRESAVTHREPPSARPATPPHGDPHLDAAACRCPCPRAPRTCLVSPALHAPRALCRLHLGIHIAHPSGIPVISMP